MNGFIDAAYRLFRSQPATVTLAGIHTFHVFDPVTEADERQLTELGKYYDDGRGHEFLHRCLHLLKNRYTVKNLTTTAGRTFLAQILCNTATETNKYVTHFAIGDSNTAAAVGDTTLGNEQFRKAVSSALDDGASAVISTFMGASEANFTWEEFGHFIDGTSSADSGTMLSHKVQQQAKSAPTTITVDSTYTLADA